jgi:hypothetical protein
VIRRAVWPYHRLPLSCREVEDCYFGHPLSIGSEGSIVIQRWSPSPGLSDSGPPE